MKLFELNESILLNEWWAEDISKNIKKKKTAGTFTKQCKEMGFRKASYNCIKYVKEEFEKIKAKYEKGTITKKEYKSWALKKKRASLANVFKRWAKKRKKVKENS